MCVQEHRQLHPAKFGKWSRLGFRLAFSPARPTTGNTGPKDTKHLSGGVAILVRKDIEIYRPTRLQMHGTNWAAVMIKGQEGAVITIITTYFRHGWDAHDAETMAQVRLFTQRIQTHIIWVGDWNRKPGDLLDCLLYTSPSPRDGLLSRMPSSA